ncbi:MAG TPA: FAD-dependent oxidoreductase [Polyangiaceae bacterium]
MRRIAIIGGGLAGLVVALRRKAAGDRVTLFEASPRFGGQLHTERRDGFTVELGAEGFVAGSEAVRALASDLGIERDLVGQLVTRSYGFDGRRLAPLEPGAAGMLLGFQVARREFGKGIGAFRAGMGELSDALAAALAGHVDLRPGSGIARLAPAGDAWRLEDERDEAHEADAVVVATNSRGASALLGETFGAPALGLARAETLSSVTVSLAYARSAVEHPLDATGFVVAESEQHEGFRACTFVSSKLQERAPEGSALLRAFFRPSTSDWELSDEAWAERAERAIRRAVPLRSAFDAAWVSRWRDALPVFDDAHRERVRALEAALAGRSVFLAGSAFHGSGIDAAVRSGDAASHALAAAER